MSSEEPSPREEQEQEQRAGHRIVAVPWRADGGDDDDGAAAAADYEGRSPRDTLDTEGRRLYDVASAYFPPQVNVSPRWLAELVRWRECAHCDVAYRDIDNFSLSCRRRTHVLPIDTEARAQLGDPRPGAWGCCLRPVLERGTLGCVAADHSDDPRMRRMREDGELRIAMPSCLWFAIPHNNRSVLLSDTSPRSRIPVAAAAANIARINGGGAIVRGSLTVYRAGMHDLERTLTPLPPREPSDDAVRAEYGISPDAHKLGVVASVFVLRFDWLDSARRREAEALARQLRV